MSKLISAIPRSQIERLQIYINKDKKTLAEIKAETGADYIINGGLYDMAHWIANCQLKAEGYVHAQDAYTYWGFGWDVGSDIAMQIVPVGNRKNYISCVELIRNSAPNGTPIYTPAQGGIRGRTAIGIAGDKLCLYVRRLYNQRLLGMSKIKNGRWGRGSRTVPVPMSLAPGRKYGPC